GVAVGLLDVDRVVLDLRHHALGLAALDVGGADLAGEVRILAVAREGAAPARVADGVHGCAEVDTAARGRVLRATGLALPVGPRGVGSVVGSGRGRSGESDAERQHGADGQRSSQFPHEAPLPAATTFAESFLRRVSAADKVVAPNCPEPVTAPAPVTTSDGRR